MADLKYSIDNRLYRQVVETKIGGSARYSTVSGSIGSAPEEVRSVPSTDTPYGRTGQREKSD